MAPGRHLTCYGTSATDQQRFSITFTHMTGQPSPPDVSAQARQQPQPRWRRILRLPVLAIAGLWFVMDAVVWAMLRPGLQALARTVPLRHMLAWLADRLDRLGPYPTLLVMLLPLALLEPAKPVGLWMIAQGRWWAGLAVLALAELIKIVLVERLFHLCRPKLLRISWFAWGYGRVMALFVWLRQWPRWRLLLLWNHRLRRILRRQTRLLARKAGQMLAWLRYQRATRSRQQDRDHR